VNTDSHIKFGIPVIAKVLVADKNLDPFSAIADLAEVFADSELLNFLTIVVNTKKSEVLNKLLETIYEI
jgi:hypothetical protein